MHQIYFMYKTLHGLNLIVSLHLLIIDVFVIGIVIHYICWVRKRNNSFALSLQKIFMTTQDKDIYYTMAKSGPIQRYSLEDEYNLWPTRMTKNHFSSHSQYQLYFWNYFEAAIQRSIASYSS